MRYALSILFLFTFLLSEIFNIPSDSYPTIQSGINMAQDGDTVLVSQGLYSENLEITHSITLASYAIYDDLSNWVEYSSIFNQWETTIQNINNTIIDGGENGSCILIYSEDNSCIDPKIIGFTIQDGSGTIVERSENINGQIVTEEINIGGGILFDISNPKINYNKLVNNGSSEVFDGGAIYATTNDEDWDFNNRNNTRLRCEVEEFNFNNNLYNNNSALFGNTLANRGFIDTFDMSESIFDVANCGTDDIPDAWIFIEEDAELILENIESNFCSITDPNVFIDSNISQECLTEGCGTQNNPFKTITTAIEFIDPSENNLMTLNLSNGEYSTDTGESLPIYLPSYVTLMGEDQSNTIINLNDYQGFIIIDQFNIFFNNLTITNGEYFNNSVLYDAWQGLHDVGGAIHIESSIVDFDYVLFTDNRSTLGGAIYIKDEAADCGTFGQGHVTINNSIFDNNYAYGGGGAIFNYLARLDLNNTIFSNNSTGTAGGFNIGDGGGAIGAYNGITYIDNSIFSNNESSLNGGAINLIGNYCNTTFQTIEVFNSKFIENTASDDGGAIHVRGLDTTLGNEIPRVIIKKSQIDYNSASDNGGGISLNNTISYIEHSTINNNLLYANNNKKGAAIFSENSFLRCINVTIAKNNIGEGNDNQGSAIYYDTGYLSGLFPANLRFGLFNSIVWGNYPNQFPVQQEAIYIEVDWSLSGAWIAYTDIEYGVSNNVMIDDCWGYCDTAEGNISNNPLFVDFNANDFSLQGNSPVIDCGLLGVGYFDGYFDFMIEESYYIGSHPDLGALEYGLTWGIGGCTDPNVDNYDYYADYDDGSCSILGDLNNSSDIDILDIIILVNLVLSSEYNSMGDLNNDLIINILDIINLVNIVLAG